MGKATEAAGLLEEMRELLELAGENPFKVRAFERASGVVGSLPDEELLGRSRAGTLTELSGIGKGIALVLTDFLEKGAAPERDAIRAKLPEGLWEMTRIPGLGPKKAQQLIAELEVRSLRDLEYACRENRLLKLKGFGDKLQARILEGIRFLTASEGQARLCDVFEVAESLVKELDQALNRERHPAGGALRVVEAGALRRRCETLAELDFLLEAPAGDREVRDRAEKALAAFRATRPGLLATRLHFCAPERFGYQWARETGTDEHWKKLGAPAAFDARDEQEFFKRLELPWIPPEARETGEEIAWARAGGLERLLPWDGVRGVFHNHTLRSDGSASLEQMVERAEKLGYAFIGISDHSQSAFYAQGLKPADLREQQREVDEVQERHPRIRVFWGIESDILADGSLDYDEKSLREFDFVIASVHSRFGMDREAMTDRILAAVRHPATRFVGHLTGRLLLGRKGYDLDIERVIRECAERDVAIEINAHPSRLDIDWRWGPELRARSTRVSINPDAHDLAGLEDTRYGVAMARKALLPTELVVNAGGVEEVEKWLARR